MKRYFFILSFLFVLYFLTGETNTLLQESNFALDFNQDISGYHATGTAIAPERGESLRLAKAEAIKFILNRIGKDQFFQELFISSWPQAITTKETRIEEVANGYRATVKLSIDRNAVVMTENQYSVAATEILERVETITEETRKR